MPRFNLPDSYWSRSRYDLDAELLTRPPGFSEFIAQHIAQSCQAQDTFFKVIERHQEDRENDPRSRIHGLAHQVNIRPSLVPDFSVSAETVAQLRVLKGPEGAEPQPQSSMSWTATTATTSAATAVQQNNAASGCCIPPACTIL